ncbi:HAMP domain-containing sensor histidine kinase [Geitlerinema sp. PCC 9228]|uniref:sensor histidine kinase n=1 Tax=Geitlerinema sp. PCC 9228 TaxID=111611 RepID=UPI0008F9D04A|nr:HAMP domain-containing sensor histidine kinase [Geitlerinema sp. PCC 9228]
MVWSNWLFLAAGAGLGIAGSWWWQHRFSKRRKKNNGRHRSPSTEDTAATWQQQIETLSQQLRQAQWNCETAWQMSQFKGGFLARVSHELRSPLNRLIGAHQLVLEGLCEDPQEEREFLEQAHQSAVRMVEMLDELLQVARSEYGRDPLKLESLAVADAFGQLYQFTHLQAKNSNIRLQVPDDPPDLYVVADRTRLTQVLVNLVDPTIRHMTEGEIHLRTIPDSSQEQVAIAIEITPPIEAWSESVHRFHLEPPAEMPEKSQYITGDRPNLSSQVKVWISQSLLELMGGSLQAIADPQNPTHISQLQCWLKKGTPQSASE